MRNKRAENRVQDDTLQLEEQLSEGYFYCCKQHPEDIKHREKYFKTKYPFVTFQVLYYHHQSDFMELKKNFDGYASLIIVIVNYCCERANNAMWTIFRKINRNETLEKVAKIIINGYVFHSKAQLNPEEHKYVLAGKRFLTGHDESKWRTGTHTVKYDNKNRPDIQINENTLCITGHGKTNVGTQVKYDDSVYVYESHPIFTVLNALGHELQIYLKQKPLNEIVDICVRNLKRNSKINIKIVLKTLGLAGMFLKHVGPTVALIVNHYTFPNKIEVVTRESSTYDIYGISSFLRQFKIPHFIIEDGDLKSVQTIKNWVKTTDFSKFKNFVIVVMSHGDAGGVIYTKDGQYNIVDDIRQPMLDNETLNEVNKYIYINACRGDLDTPRPKSKKIRNREEGDSPKTRALPDNAKNLTEFHSTEEGFRSQRCKSGSPAIQTLLEKLNDRIKSSDDIDMKLVYQETITTTYNDMQKIEKYQRPEYSTTNKGDLVWNIKEIYNLYILNHGDLKVSGTSFSTRPQLHLVPPRNLDSDTDSDGLATSSSLQCPEYKITTVGVTWTIESVFKLYRSNHEDLKVNEIDFFKCSQIKRDLPTDVNTDLKDSIPQSASSSNTNDVVPLGKYCVYVADHGVAVTDDYFWKIEQIIHFIIFENCLTMNPVPYYTIITKNGTNYKVIDCYQSTWMKLFIRYIERVRHWSTAELNVIPVFDGSFKKVKLKIKLPIAGRNIQECKRVIGQENPKLECEMWSWVKLVQGGKSLYVALNDLDVNLLEYNDMMIRYHGYELKITMNKDRTKLWSDMKTGKKFNYDFLDE